MEIEPAAADADVSTPLPQTDSPIKRTCKLRSRVATVSSLHLRAVVLFFPSCNIPFTRSVQIRNGLIQQLETTQLAPLAAASCDVMTFLRPATNQSLSSPGSECDPRGVDAAAASEKMVWEAMSCVVSLGNLWKEQIVLRNLK
jgi:hypothetical protein